jgi:hypothetical protein
LAGEPKVDVLTIIVDAAGLEADALLARIESGTDSFTLRIVYTRSEVITCTVVAAGREWVGTALIRIFTTISVLRTRRDADVRSVVAAAVRAAALRTAAVAAGIRTAAAVSTVAAPITGIRATGAVSTAAVLATAVLPAGVIAAPGITVVAAGGAAGDGQGQRKQSKRYDQFVGFCEH